MSTSFYRGQQLGRNDLNIFLVDSSNKSVNAYEITYALYDFTTGQEVLVGAPRRDPANPSIGEYYASFVVPMDANLGNFRIRWTFRELSGGAIQQALQEFEVADKSSPIECPTGYTTTELDLIRRVRNLLRDNDPDANYHFRPPTHESTVKQYNRVFGHIWKDEELKDYIEAGMWMVVSAPPRTPFQSVDQMVQIRPEWRTLLLTGAMVNALQALRINWIADDFSYSIGGVSLDLDKSSKYEGALQFSAEQFDKQLEKAKATVNVIRGLAQPRFGIGIRSAFGPHVGAGVMSPRKFVGF